MANRYNKMYLISSIIKGMKIKTTIWSIPSPPEWLKLKRLMILSVTKNTEQQKLSYIDGRSVNWRDHFENTGIFYEADTYMSSDPEMPLLGICPADRHCTKK